MKAMVLDTGVCCILPKLTCENDLDPTQFVWRPLKPTPDRSLYVASLQTRGETAYVKALNPGGHRGVQEKGERLSQAA